jgi:hypothetical protein
MTDGLTILRLPVNHCLFWNWLSDKTKVTTSYKNSKIIRRTATYKGLDYSYFVKGQNYTAEPERTQVKGSIHVYYNNGKGNETDFNFSSLVKALKQFSQETGIDLKNTVLNGLEIGVNILLPFHPDYFFLHIVHYRNKPFQYKVSNTEISKICCYTQFRIKFYDKGLQKELPIDLGRFEIAFDRMEILNKIGIRTLSDLINPEKYQKLGELLLKYYDGILVGNSIVDKSDLKHKKQLSFEQGHRAEYWRTFEKSNKGRCKRSREKKKFKTILVNTGADQLKAEMRERIKQKIEELKA